ncbi:MAG: hypothetical protein ACTSRZ_17695 [Promethearchaeota archaeon]
MGVKFGPYLRWESAEKYNFFRKSIAIDASYVIISFIKNKYGNRAGRKNSNKYSSNIVIDKTQQAIGHLYGIFYRTIKLYEIGAYPIYCFDGIPDEKKRIIPKHSFNFFNMLKKRYEEAIALNNKELANQLALRHEYLFTNAVREIRDLLNAMGVPYINAPSEAEAQCAQLIKMKICDYVLSSDFDVLLFGGKNLLHLEKFIGSGRNMKIKGRIYNLNSILSDLQINRFQLIDLAIIIGNDYFKGIPNIGFKTGLKIIKDYKSLDLIIEDKENPFYNTFTKYLNKEKLNELRKLFIFPVVLNKNINIEYCFPKRGKIIDILCDKHNLNRNRVENGIERLIKAYKKLNYNKKYLKNQSILNFL